MKNRKMNREFRVARVRRKDLDKYLSKMRLGRRGWSEQMISRFLGAPDGIFPNPHCHAKPILLYQCKRVFRAERTAACKDAATVAAIRRVRSQKVAERRKLQTVGTAIDCPLTVPSLSARELQKAALKNVRSNHLDGLLESGAELDQEKIRSLMESFLYQQTYPRDLVAAAIEHRPGAFRAKNILRKRVHRAIAARYPRLVQGMLGYGAGNLELHFLEKEFSRNRPPTRK